MEYPKLYSTLESIIDSGNNPFDLNYWTPVYFHPYTSLVVGEWIKTDSPREYDRFASNIKRLGDFQEFRNFMWFVQSRVTAMGWICPPDMFFKESKIRHDFDNKVAVSLLGKNEEVLVLGWCDHKFCIGTELSKPFLSCDGKAYSINTDKKEFI